MGTRIAPVQVNVLVGSLDLPSNVHLDTGVGSDGDVGSPAHLHELGKNKTGRAGTNKENSSAERHLEDVHTVDGTRGGFEKGSLLVGEVLNFVALGEVASYFCKLKNIYPVKKVKKNNILLDVVGETTVSGNTSGGEVLTEKFGTLSAIVAVTAGFSDIGSNTVTDVESLHLVTHSDDSANSFMARNQLRVKAQSD